MEKIVREFFRTREIRGPILVGFSGGPDSSALVHLLPFRPVLAHVDHGWREESEAEADHLESLAHSLQLPFYRTRLLPQGLSNREEIARKLRYSFFQELYQRLGCQALVLGHQADDQAETVFKRLLEGSGLTALGAMENESAMEGMTIWRPLLEVTKEEIVKWLDLKGISYLKDPSNSDRAYLRARLREELFPFIRSSFGKEFEKNLCLLGKNGRELKEHLLRRTAPLFEVVREWGVDLNPFLPIDRFELKFFLQAWCHREKIPLSREAKERLADLILEGGEKRSVSCGKQLLCVDRGRIEIKSE